MSWIHVNVGSETISSTPEHPYFILNASSDTPLVKFEGKESNSTGSWVAAKDLVAGMKVLLSNGKCDTINSVEVEHLEQPETTYNFEVEDFHTYFVGEDGILVHNACGGDLTDDIATGGAKDYSIHDSSNSAFRAAKSHAGIPMSEQPTSVIQSVDRLGKAIPGRTYIFENGTTIMQHSAGHVFPGGVTMSPHYNILGSRMHFFYPGG